MRTPLARRKPLHQFLATLLSMMFVFAGALTACATTDSSSIQLVIRIDEAASIEVHASLIEVKVRLEKGVAAQVWTAESCATPRDNATSISRSGSYSFAVDSFQQSGESNICLVTTDNKVRAQAPLR